MRRVALGQEALYRVVEATPDTVDVEVVRAPGLQSGSRVRFTAAAARAMEHLTLEPAGAGEAAEEHAAPLSAPRGSLIRR